MKGRLILVGGLAALSLGLAAVGHAAPSGDFALGVNSEKQSCRAVERFDAQKGAKAADIYCGQWERPSGRITVYASDAAAADALAQLCKGDAVALQSSDYRELRQVACARTEQGGVRRYGLIARRGSQVAIGDVYPSDWGPLVAAARVLTGAARATAASADASVTPGLREIQGAFPGGPPGQSDEVNYEVLRRLAYEHNLIWSFAASQRDFQELLRAQRRTAPDDLAGEAEILAEIGLNMSSARRFDEAAEVLNQAAGRASAAGDPLLPTKVTNYQAIDQLNQRHFGTAMRLALAANQARADLARADQTAGVRISVSDVRQVESRAADQSHRSLLVELSDNNSPGDRAAILSAQGSFIAGVAARGLGRPDASSYLAAASNWLAQAKSPPAWLIGAVANERSDLLYQQRDFAGAAAASQSALAIMQTVAPGTRSEAHMWLSLESAQDALGHTSDALVSGRAAFAIYGRQSESPGLPPDVAATHLGLLLKEWRRTGDAQLASEYFQDLALVWDSAAARTTAQLAARLVLRQAGDEARAYQDAERAYRAAYARRQALSADPDKTGEQLARADAAVHAAAAALATAEDGLRAKAPAYIELLSPQVSSDDLRGVLADHEAYLRIAMSSDGGFGALVEKDGVHPFAISLTASQVDALVDRLRRTTRLRGRALPSYDLDAAEELFDGLLRPMSAELAGVQSLDLDVSGSLASAPFGALVASHPDAATIEQVRTSSDYSHIDWLARHLSVANTLGPAAFVRLRKEPAPTAGKLTAAVYGDYQPDPATAAERIAKSEDLTEACRRQVEKALAALGALPETADEARSVAATFDSARLVVGPDFTDADFMQSPQTSDADVIVLATHGVLALSSCFAEPALLASVGANGDGLIEASQLLDRQLKARLVVLSACDTAAAGKLDEARTGLGDGGDALSGLARAFIYAGARNVLATEWKVDASASGSEIIDLLSNANQPGAHLGQALSVAEAKLYDQAETSHPFYWAAFVLVGDGGGELKPAASVAER